VEITFADGRSDFQIGISGNQFANYNISCPDGPSVGGPGSIEHECLDGGLWLHWPESAFPDTFEIIVDNGEIAEYSPDWTTVQGCSLVCTSGAFTVE
jgi:hypothetical protein